MISKMKETEYNLSKKYGKKWTIRGNERYDVDYIENIVKTKWLKKLEGIDKQPTQLNLFDKFDNKGGNNDKRKRFVF